MTKNLRDDIFFNRVINASKIYPDVPMKVKRFVTVCLCCWAVTLPAQDFPVGIRAQALGGCGAAYASDSEGQLSNPALVSAIDNVGITVFYARPFGLAELPLTALSAAARWRRFAVGVAGVALEHELASARNYALTLATTLGSSQTDSVGSRWLVLGLQGELSQLEIARYGQTTAYIVSLGLAARLAETLRLGVALRNLTSATRNGTNERLPRSAVIGLAYAPYERFLFQMEVYKQSEFALEWRGGVEIAVTAPLAIRLGLSSNPDRLTAGIALRLKPVAIQYTAFSHLELGWTQQFAVSVQR